MHPEFPKTFLESTVPGYLDTMQSGSQAYNKRMEPLCREWGLTRNELDVLLFLYNNPDLDRAADIVQIRRISKSHVSLSVSNLEQRGLLTRQFDPADRRTAHLNLTEEAIPIAKAGKQAQREFFTRVFAGLSVDELILWRSLLDKVCENIKTMVE